MAQLKTFRDLLVWRKAHELVLFTYRITGEFPKNEMFGLVSQLRRAAVSVAANVVEGFRRNTLKDSLSFYNIADASLEELKYHLLLATDLMYINQQIYKQATTLSDETGKLLTRWIQSQRRYL